MMKVFELQSWRWSYNNLFFLHAFLVDLDLILLSEIWGSNVVLENAHGFARINGLPWAVVRGLRSLCLRSCSLGH